jgi:hypothetical protein
MADLTQLSNLPPKVGNCKTFSGANKSTGFGNDAAGNASAKRLRSGMRRVIVVAAGVCVG